MTLKGVVNLLHLEGAEVPALKPVVTFALSVADDKIRVYFDQAMRATNSGNSDDALNPVNYNITSGLGIARSIVSIVAVGVSPTIVEVTLSGELTDGAAYNVDVSNVLSIYGVPLDVDHTDADFTGQGTGPSLESAVADSVTQITVVFDGLMNHDSALQNSTNYNVSGPTVVGVASVVATDVATKTHCVCQLTGEMTTGVSYTIAVTGVSDDAYNPILGSPDNEASFSGIGDHPRVASTATPQPLGVAVKIVFSELMGSSVLVPGNYTIEGPSGTFLAVSFVELVDDDYTYKLTTEQQVAAQAYTITVSGSVLDMYSNGVLAPYNEATFIGSGYSPPEITMNPEDQSIDVDIRRKLLVTAKDPTDEFTGVNMSTWWTRLTYSREGAPRDIVQYAIKDGVVQPGFEGGVLRGDPMDPDTGVTMWMRPMSRKWLQETQYQVETYVEDNEFVPNENLVVGWFRTGESSCFEDNLPTPTETDTLLSRTLSYPNCEKLRMLIGETSTVSSLSLVRARTLLYLACITDLKTILAGLVDYSLVDEIQLCGRRPVLDVYNKVVKYPRVVRDAVYEIPNITGEARDAILKQLRSNSAVYVVNAVAIVVVLCALMSED